MLDVRDLLLVLRAAGFLVLHAAHVLDQLLGLRSGARFDELDAAFMKAP